MFGLNRFLLLLIALFVLWRLLSAIGSRQKSTAAGADDFSRFSARSRARRRRQRESLREAGELVACSECGTYVPAGRALAAGDGDVVCSEACRSARNGRAAGTG